MVSCSMEQAAPLLLLAVRFTTTRTQRAEATHSAVPAMSTSTVKPNEAARNPDQNDLSTEAGETEYPTRSLAADESFVQEPPEADAWDKEIQEDAKAGKLNALLEEARKEHRKGETQPLP